MNSEDIFERARDAGITVDALSEFSGLNRGAFVRWKSGKIPNDDFIAKAISSLDEMILAKANGMIDAILARAETLLSLKQPS